MSLETDAVAALAEGASSATGQRISGGNMNYAAQAQQAQLETIMNRGLWEFEYTAAKLVEAAQQQKAHRISRVTVWEGKKDEVMRKIKESGLTVHEGVAASLSNYTAQHMQGAHVMVDPTLQSDLSECVGKIDEHRKASTEYDGWIQMLSANAEARLKLKYHDWMFFFGK